MAEHSGDTAKIRLRYMVADPGAQWAKGASLLEGWDYQTPSAMLDGPVCRRVAVVDLDPATGALVAGASFLPALKGRKIGRYGIIDDADPTAADFQQVSVFGAVMKTMAMFEEADVLGRPLRSCGALGSPCFRHGRAGSSRRSKRRT